MALTTVPPAAQTDLSPEAQEPIAAPAPRPGGVPMPNGALPEQSPGHFWRWLLVIAALLLSGVAAWRLMRPKLVQVVHPRWTQVTESIAASGIVVGERETPVGAQVSGTVEELRVREGDVVHRGDVLGRIHSPVAAAQVRQAEAGLRRARAELEQAQSGALRSEIEAASERTRQARASLEERLATRSRAAAPLIQSQSAYAGAGTGVRRAEATLRQAQSRLVLARANLERYRYLFGEGAISRQILDQVQSDYDSAVAEISVQNEAIASAKAQEASARAAIAVAQQDIRAAEAQVLAARSAVSGASADLQTLQSQPRPEIAVVARRRVAEAEAAVAVARESAGSAVVRAPFDGVVTQVVAEVGAPAGPSGIVRLVESGRPQVKLDLDENRLAELRVGQKAIIDSAAYRGTRLEGRVARIGAAVDSTRGTIEITVVPSGQPSWLRPGHTVNVNLILSEGTSRMLVPATALIEKGDQHLVLIVRNGRARVQPVVAGEIEGNMAPILSGLSENDLVIRTAAGIEPGARVAPVEAPEK